MTRAINNVASRRRRKKVLKEAKGYVGGRSRLYKTAAAAVDKANLYAYRDRKAKKRTFRQLWIIRINAAVRELGFKYSEFIHRMSTSGILLDRKVLAEMAYNDIETFNKLVYNIMK